MIKVLLFLFLIAFISSCGLKLKPREVVNEGDKIQDVSSPYKPGICGVVPLY
jgi:hypothetical protein